jgi:hypothetical protein
MLCPNIATAGVRIEQALLLPIVISISISVPISSCANICANACANNEEHIRS